MITHPKIAGPHDAPGNPRPLLMRCAVAVVAGTLALGGCTSTTTATPAPATTDTRTTGTSAEVTVAPAPPGSRAPGPTVTATGRDTGCDGVTATAALERMAPDGFRVEAAGSSSSEQSFRCTFQVRPADAPPAGVRDQPWATVELSAGSVDTSVQDPWSGLWTYGDRGCDSWDDQQDQGEQWLVTCRPRDGSRVTVTSSVLPPQGAQLPLSAQELAENVMAVAIDEVPLG